MNKFLTAALLSFAAIFSLPANATLIDFEGDSGYAQNSGDFFDIDGYRFTLTDVSGGFLTVTAQSDLIEGTTTKLFAANHSILTLSRVDGGSFDLLSVDVGGSWEDQAIWHRWADKVSIFDGSATVDVTLLGQGAVFHATNTNFLSVSSVVFSPTGSRGTSDFEFNIDNISLRAGAVPEPESLALVGLGLLAIVARRRKTAKQS
jgi:hypothetical protein